MLEHRALLQALNSLKSTAWHFCFHQIETRAELELLPSYDRSLLLVIKLCFRRNGNLQAVCVVTLHSFFVYLVMTRSRWCCEPTSNEAVMTKLRSFQV